jgi:hypothetical protein
MTATTPELATLADRFVDLACLSYQDDSLERRAEAATLLAREPRLVDMSIHAAAAAGDPEALLAILDRPPEVPDVLERPPEVPGVFERPGGPRAWVPLLSLCYSRVPQVDAVACLDLFLTRGADPNAFTTITECRFTALTGVMGEGEQGPIEQPPHSHARAMALRLLGAGASPNESQGLYNTHFQPSNDWLELLLARGLTSDLDYLLGQAAQQGFEERVALLLAHGAAPGGRNHYNRRTHLENALLEGHGAIARMLFAAGASAPSLTDEERFQVAVVANDAAEALRILGTYPLANERPGALIAAARHGRLDAVKLALQLGVPIDGVDHGGLTALHHAAQKAHLEVVRLLLDEGASRTIEDPVYHGTPLGHARHFARRWPHRDAAAVVALLESTQP